MRYWWVNQNQTFQQEVEGGYLWSPKRKSNGARNHFYECMREVSPGDLIFSFSDTRVPALGVARSYCRESPKPAEFGDVGQNWEAIGWKVSVRFTELVNKIRPKDHMNVLGPLLPAKYAPLQSSGDGLQAVYLTELPEEFAEVMIGLIGDEGMSIARSAGAVEPLPVSDLEMWEWKLERQVEQDSAITDTQREAVVLARRGQGLFRLRVSAIEHCCRVTGVHNPVHLIASHIKPWRDSNNLERLDGENGLLLTPSIDHLFDRGFIGFEDDGNLLISPVAHGPSLVGLGVNPHRHLNVGAFTPGQRRYLEFHRSAVFLKRGEH
jgi:putative restriction endonuclease